MEAFLKPLEDTPPHVYFLLLTTEPTKILATVRSRATEIKFSAVGAKDMAALLARVCGAEGIEISEEVRDKLVEAADGSPRKALVLLNQIVGLGNDAERLEAIQAGDAAAKAFDLARLLWKGARWGEVSKAIKAIDEEPETVRRICLGYFTSCLLGNGGGRAYELVMIFERAWFDGGKASLAASCWEAVNLGKG